MQVDGVFACDHIGDGGTCSAGLFGREFSFRRHICCCGRKIGLVAWVYERRPREKVLGIPISEMRWTLGVGCGEEDMFRIDELRGVKLLCGFAYVIMNGRSEPR